MFAESMMYQIEVYTTSESEETRIVRFNPNTLQQALDQSFENKIKVNTGSSFFSTVIIIRS